jgi:hypothetical protein
MLVNGYKIGPRADLRGAKLKGADLQGADLRYAFLLSADLSHANIHGANLEEADLKDANLTGAYLRFVNLKGADLRGANLTGAVFQNADLYHTTHSVYDLVGAELANCVLPSQFFNLIPRLYENVHFNVDFDPYPCSENIVIYLNLLVSIARVMGITERADLLAKLEEYEDYDLVLEAIETTERTEDILQLMADAAFNMRQIGE